jgi:hypothetical protein
MRASILVGSVSLLALSGCGLENLFGNVAHHVYERPASKIRGRLPQAADGRYPVASQLTVVDGSGGTLPPFARDAHAGSYEIRLPSSKYSMVEVEVRGGDMLARAIVPFVGEESEVDGVDVGARSVAEALIVEARLSADGKTFRQLTPSAYLGTRAQILAAFDATAPTADQAKTQELLHMVEAILPRFTADSASGPFFFLPPQLDASFQVKSSPLEKGWLSRNVVDYDGDGIRDTDTAAFDAKLAEVAQLYDPSGCLDPTHVRLVFTVDFNQGALNGNCATINRFTWAVDKPGKSMFFVGWIHKESEVTLQDPEGPAINNALGASTPNQIAMNDDGTNGDEVAGDGIWTVVIDVPYDPARKLRIGYKYTWGTRGAVWTGSEEWPGNSRILEVRDIGGSKGPSTPDGFVHRRDVFGDEATNKDLMNLNANGNGSVTWTTDLHGCGPEAVEQPFTLHNDPCAKAPDCGTWHTPTSVGPLTVACPAGP